ncbi:hypothetical protein JTB14_029846 [Gonioctena quinquepunctata]|nr:hypothetical protein JTB14_029846 [Gonioctena quinquepunctata]
MLALKQSKRDTVGYGEVENKIATDFHPEYVFKEEMSEIEEVICEQAEEKAWNTFLEENVGDSEKLILELFDKGLVKNPQHYQFVNDIDFPVVSYGSSKLFINDFIKVATEISKIFVEISLEMLRRKYRKNESTILPLEDISCIQQYGDPPDNGCPIYKPFLFGGE